MITSFVFSQIEEECLPNNSINELVNECDSFVKTEPNVIEEEYPFDENSSSSNAEERGHQLASNEMEIDHEMLANGMKFECVRFLKLFSP